MKYIRNSYRNYSRVYNLLIFGISISIVLGLIISVCLDNELILNIYNYFIEYINNYNSNILDNILYPFIVYIIIFILSLTLIGVFMPFLAVFLENISIGLILGILVRINGLNGLLIWLIYFIFIKLLYLVVLIFITINIYKFVKNLILSIKYKKNDSIYNIYSRIILKVFFCIILITIINLINVFIVPKIFSLIKYLV